MSSPRKRRGCLLLLLLGFSASFYTRKGCCLGTVPNYFAELLCFIYIIMKFTFSCSGDVTLLKIVECCRLLFFIFGTPAASGLSHFGPLLEFLTFDVSLGLPFFGI